MSKRKSDQRTLKVANIMSNFSSYKKKKNNWCYAVLTMEWGNRHFYHYTSENKQGKHFHRSIWQHLPIC